MVLAAKVQVHARECTDDMLTVVMPTYETGPFHKAAIWQFDSIYQHICELILVWDKPEPAAVARVTAYAKDTRFPVRLDIVEGRDATLSNRFKPHDEVKTTTILQIDDDILARPQGVIAGLQASLEHPDQLVSWASCVKIGWGGSYRTLWTLPFTNSCEMGMTNAAFLNKKYHKLFWEESALMALVHAHHNCEDIGMNFVIEKELRRLHKEAMTDPEIPELSTRVNGTAVYMVPPTRQFINANHIRQSAWRGKSPLDSDEEFDEARLKRWKSGISTSQTGHIPTRNKCIQEFARLFGFQPKVQTPYTITWHPACFPGMRGHCHDAMSGEVRMDYSTYTWLDAAGEEPKVWAPVEGIGDRHFLRISANEDYDELKNPNMEAKVP